MSPTMTVEELREQEEAQARRLAETNGKSIEDMADDSDIDDEDEVVVIEGTSGQLSLAVGGRKPDGSEFRMRSAAVKVDGQYTKGETVVLRVIARIDEIDLVDTHDDFGTVTACKRVHKAKPISVERVDEAPEQE